MGTYPSAHLAAGRGVLDCSHSRIRVAIGHLSSLACTSAVKAHGLCFILVSAAVGPRICFCGAMCLNAGPPNGIGRGREAILSTCRFRTLYLPLLT